MSSITMKKPPLDPTTKKKNRILLTGLLAGMLILVVWSLLFLQKNGLNLEGGYH